MAECYYIIWIGYNLIHLLMNIWVMFSFGLYK